MRICLDARMIGGEFSGIPRHAQNLVRLLAEMDQKNEYVALMNSDVMDELAKEYPNLTIHKVNIPLYSVQEQYQLPIKLRNLHVDLYHSFTYTAPVYQPCKTIMTIYDLIPVVFPHYFRLVHKIYFRWIVKPAAQNCSRVITTSNFSKWDLCVRLRIPPEKVAVILEGMEPEFFARKRQPGERRAYPKKYLLNVSNSKLHKNTVSVIRAFNLIAHKIEHDLVIVGAQNPEVKRLVSRLRLWNRVCIREGVSDDELIKLYRDADVFVFPSLYEGFGLPPLEAMASSTPAISSYTGSLAEILGDAAILVCPLDAQGMADAIMNLLNDPALREDLIAKGLERVKIFDWKKTAANTLKLYEEVFLD